MINTFRGFLLAKNLRFTGAHFFSAIRPFFWIAAMSFFISACSGTSTTKNQPVSLSLVEINQAITLANDLASPEKDHRYISLAEQLLALGETQKGLTLINKIQATRIDDDNYIRYVLVASRLYNADQAVFRSELLLSETRLQQIWPSLPTDVQEQLLRQKASTFSQLGNAIESIKQRVELSGLLTDSIDVTENNELLWQELNTLSTDELRRQASSNSELILNGWYQLALINKTNEANLDNKRIEVNNWVGSNSSHPASIELPLDLQLLNSLIERRPRKVALLLPVDGKLATAGNTIRNGFMAAYYNHNAEYVPEIIVYDTSFDDINWVYDRAVSEGADLIIGPLQKEKLQELQNRAQLPVAILALNYNSDGQQTSLPSGQAIYQFGLSLEDEAIQAADRAWLEGHRYAMVLAESASWSQRAAIAFSQRWQELGGIIAVNQQFTGTSNYSDTIKIALDIDNSQNRARKLKRLFGKLFEFEPRSRQDIDMIFLISRASQGQQIKPTLAFHYAGNIPVYATSQIYSPQDSASKNSDLNGIRFTSLPWTLEPEKRDPNLINDNVKVPPNYERLYAMGIDAFLIHDRLQQLARSPNTSIYGTTGKLRLDLEKRIIREQPWAHIVKGKAEVLPQLTQDFAQ